MSDLLKIIRLYIWSYLKQYQLAFIWHILNSILGFHYKSKNDLFIITNFPAFEPEKNNYIIKLYGINTEHYFHSPTNYVKANFILF